MKLTFLKGVRAIAFDGAFITVVDPEGVTHTVSVDPGPVDLTPYQPLCNLGECELDGFLVYASTGARGALLPQGLYASAASETYSPSMAEKQEAQMRQLVKGMVRNQLARERERAIANVQAAAATAPAPNQEAVAPAEPTVATDETSGETSA